MPFIDNIWKPNLKQERFLSIPISIKEAFYGGGAGSGKSEVLLMYAIVHGWHRNPKFKQVFLRSTFPELRREIVPRSKEIYPHFGGKFNQSDMCWNFADEGGGHIFLGHCENEDDVHKYDSMEINLFTPDELTSLTEWKYLYIAFTRVRTSDPKLPSIIRAAGMPGGIGHSFVNSRFVLPNPQGNVIIKGKGGNKRIFIPATLADNPHIDKGYSQSLEALPEAEKRAKKYGDWNAYQGQVFEEFRDRQYPDEPLNALHVIEPFKIPEFWPKIVAMDWGFAPPAMTYVSYGAISPTKRLYVYREQYWQKTKITDWAPYVKEFIDAENPAVIKMCKSAGQDRGQEHTILQQVTDALGHNVELTSNTAGSRIAGKLLLHEYLRWSPNYLPTAEKLTYDDAHAQWLLRNKGLIEYRKYLALFNEAEEETNLPKIQIFNTNIKLIEAIKACAYDKVRTEDVCEFGGDDPYDTIRYLVDIADKYFGDAEKQFEKLQQVDTITQRLTETGDWNTYYRQARILESSEKMAPIRRYHRVH